MAHPLPPSSSPAQGPSLPHPRAVALHAFVGHVVRATELLAALQEHLDDHMGVSPEGVHWGHVGSASKVAQDLEELCRFLGVKA